MSQQYEPTADQVRGAQTEWNNVYVTDNRVRAVLRAAGLPEPGSLPIAYVVSVLTMARDLGITIPDEPEHAICDGRCVPVEIGPAVWVDGEGDRWERQADGSYLFRDLSKSLDDIKRQWPEGYAPDPTPRDGIDAFTDIAGDRWYRDMSGNYTMSIQNTLSRGYVGQPFSWVEETYGPLTY